MFNIKIIHQTRLYTLDHLNKMKDKGLGAGGSYLAGERAGAGSLGLGVLDSAVLVGIKNSPCRKKSRVLIRQVPSGNTLSHSVKASFIPPLHLPERSRSLAFCSSAEPARRTRLQCLRCTNEPYGCGALWQIAPDRKHWQPDKSKLWLSAWWNYRSYSLCSRFNERNPAGGLFICANTLRPCLLRCCQVPARWLWSERQLGSQLAADAGQSPKLCLFS